MHAIPALDLRDGHVVQLEQGLLDREKVRLPDPVAEARKWRDRGAEWLHVVDLDRAFGRGSNLDVIRAVLDAVGGDLSVQVGGGVRSIEDAEEVLAAGAHRVVAGTRAVTDDAFLREAATRFGERFVVAVDAREGEIVAKGWTEGTGKRLIPFALQAARLGVGGLLYTDVGREGLLGGANVAGVRALVDAVPGTPIIASGGVASVDDLLRLQAVGAFGAVVGMAFYTGKIEYERARADLARAARSP